jgi:hypothetical protein
MESKIVEGERGALFVCAALMAGGGVACAEPTGLLSGLNDLPKATAQPYRLDARPGVESFLLAQKSGAAAKPDSRESLFDDDEEEEKPGEEPAKATPKSDKSEKSLGNWKGFVQFEAARTTESPVHWSKMITRADLSSQGNLGDGIKYKIGARVDYDAVYSLYNYYPGPVADDQRFNIYLRENYLDVSSGDWDYRFGKQHVVWGEMVGLFFADVVSARDMREFILPEFDMMRITQWAARAEYFKDDFHAELLWIPVASYDETGKPGAEFFPNQPQFPGLGIQYRNEDFPTRSANHGNYGARLSMLKNGWDVSGFAYSSMDIMPTFYRDATSVPGTLVYQARHDRITQYGGTLAKDFGSVVLKAESVYTHGRQFTVLTLDDPNGVVPQNTLDWALGLDFTLLTDTRFNVQLFQRTYFDHDPNQIFDAHENGYSLLLNHKLTDKLEAQVTWISSLNRTDWLLRPRLQWNFERNWRLAVGADIFKGPPTGLFGRYDNNDRVYSEVRYSF